MTNVGLVCLGISRLAEAAVAMVTAWLAVLAAVCCCVDEQCEVCKYPCCMLVAADMTVAGWATLQAHTVTACVCCLWSAYTVYSLHHAECMSPTVQATRQTSLAESLSKSVNLNTVYRFDIYVKNLNICERIVQNSLSDPTDRLFWPFEVYLLKLCN